MNQNSLDRRLVSAAALLLLTSSVCLAQPFSGALALEQSRSDSGDLYGWRVALEGDALAVSSPAFDGGTVYLYKRDPLEPDAWTLARRFQPPDACDAWSIDLSGDTLAVGGCLSGCGKSAPAAVYLYQRDKGGADNWGLFQIIRADFPEPTEHTFGYAVAIDRDLLAIGDPELEIVRTYERKSSAAGGWTEIGRLSHDPAPFGTFGSALALSGGTLAVGAANYCVGPSTTDFHSNGVFTFERDASAAEGWAETRHLDNPGGDGLPGESLALEGPNLIFNGLDGIELHERDHKGLKRWGQRQLFEFSRAFAIRGRSAVLVNSQVDGAQVSVRDRIGGAGQPWSITETFFEPSSKDHRRVSSAAVGPREVVVGYGEDGDTPRKVVIYSRDPIHADDFESGGLEQWDLSKRKVAPVEPGLAGSAFALEAVADGKGKKSFVRTRRPDQEPMVSLRFRLNANEVALGGQDVEIVRLSGGGKKNVAVTLREHKGAYRLTLWARQNSGPLLELGELDIPAREDARLLLEWMRATGDDHDNGVVRLSRIGRTSVESATLANDRLTISDIRVGFPAGAKGTAGGSFLVDDVALHQ